MSQVKKIDFAAVQDVRKELKRLIANNPNPLRSIDSLEYLDDLTRDKPKMSKPGKQRIAEYRERLKAEGIRGIYLFIHDNDRERLQMLADSMGITISECVTRLIKEASLDPKPRVAPTIPK